MEIKPVTKETSKFNGALHAKCPRCRQGNMFANSMYGFKTQVMNEYCPHCGLKFEREPGYFYVAMFVSYAFNVVQMVAIGLLTYFITGEDDSPWLYIAVIFAGVVLLSPFNYRYSRIVLLYWLTPGLNYSPERRDQPGRNPEIKR